jgi:hypothetical protein
MKKRTNQLLLAGYGAVAVAGIAGIIILRVLVTFQ